MSLTAGLPWLNRFKVAGPCEVVLFDNDLDPATIAFRLNEVAVARGVERGHFGERLHVEPLRGQPMDIEAMGKKMSDLSGLPKVRCGVTGGGG
jgi:hypothetical protein